MDPIRVGRTVLFLLPYVLLGSGLFVATKAVDMEATLQALAVAAVGGFWAYLRVRHQNE